MDQLFGPLPLEEEMPGSSPPSGGLWRQTGLSNSYNKTVNIHPFTKACLLESSNHFDSLLLLTTASPQLITSHPIDGLDVPTTGSPQFYNKTGLKNQAIH